MKPNRLTSVLFAGALAAVAGCTADSDPAAGPRDLTTGDFVGRPPLRTQPHDDMSEALEASEAPAPAEAEQPPLRSGPMDPDTGGNVGAPSLQDQTTYRLDAMVGQVNGRAIYADTVLAPIEEQLAALARQWSPNEFRQRARQLIAGRLDQIVTDALILGVAERDLSEREQMGLKVMIQKKREELLRQYGRGSLSLAQHNILEETGKSLDETLQEHRQQVVVQRYLREKLIPKINVTRRDVERYYNDHLNEFQPDPQRTLRLIRVQSDDDAARVGAMLATTPFEQVAQDKLNLFKPAEGGLMDKMTGDRLFEDAALNEAALGLKPGEWAGPLPLGKTQAFVYLDEMVVPEGKPLMEVRLDIERLLREQQFRDASAAERQRLLREGSYNPLDQMADAVLQIAMARYAGAAG